MAYIQTDLVNIKQLKSLAVQVRSELEDFDSRVSSLEELAESLLNITNSILANIERNS